MCSGLLSEAEFDATSGHDHVLPIEIVLIVESDPELRARATDRRPNALVYDDMRALVNNQDFSDITFIIDGQPVYASRVHLAARSEHFRAMLYGGMRESFQENCHEVSKRAPSLFRPFVEFASSLAPLCTSSLERVSAVA